MLVLHLPCCSTSWLGASQSLGLLLCEMVHL